MEGREKKRNPLVGIVLSFAFMLVGVFGMLFPDLGGVNAPSGRFFNIFLGAVLFVAGLLELLYIIGFRRADKSDS
jgi:hypothetical protein